jgi:type IV pilus secretin PilQ/predicted competence protein
MNRKKRPLKLLTGFNLKASCICVLLAMILLFPGTPLFGDAPPSQKVILETIRAGSHGNYSSVVFEFGNPFQCDKPLVHGDEVRFSLKNVTTALPPYREYKVAESWVRLEQTGNDLNVRTGLLKNLLRLRYFSLENPARLVINLYRDEARNVFSSEKTAADSENNAKSTPAVVKDRLAGQGQKNKEPQATKKNIHPNPPAKTTSTAKNQGIIDPSSKQQLLTMNFFQGDIQEILSGLAMQQKINIVTAQDVSGKVSVHLYNVPFNKTLDAICRAGGFSYHKRGDIYYVFKPKEAQEPQAENLKLRIFKLEYADMDKIQGVLDAIPGIRMIKIHEPSKSIIVEDTPENISKIEYLVRFWDFKPKQVMIEAKILEVDLTDDMALGVNWEQIMGDVRIGTGGFTAATIPTDTGISPVPATGEGIFGNIITAVGTRHQFTAALDALQTKTKINTLSTPKILAIHSKPARVQVGGQQGYSVTTISDGIATTSIEFIDTGTILEITPFIDNENNVLLKVQPEINSARIEEGGIPVVKSTQVTTWLRAKNGETVFIGGLIQNTRTETRNRVPCLGDIPGLGLLFGRAFHGTGKSELIVLITPQILEDGTPKDQEAIEKTNEMEKGFKTRSSSPLDLLKPLTPNIETRKTQ